MAYSHPHTRQAAKLNASVPAVSGQCEAGSGVVDGQIQSTSRVV